MIPMRDGVRLATDVYVPSNDGTAPAPGRFPVLLLRTPYNKKYWSERAGTLVAAPAGTLSPRAANGHGYVIVYQDVRGTFDSGGILEPMLNEGNDGFDTVEWLRRQGWSDGRVATLGPSYLGGDQMVLAAERPPGLLTAFSQIPGTDPFRNEWVYMDGVLSLTSVRWTLRMVGGTVARLRQDDQDLLKADYAALGILSPNAMTATDVAKLMWSLPLKEMPIVRRAPWWADWLRNRDNPGYFVNAAIAGRFSRVNIPILHLGGWYDLFLRNTYEQYENISSQAQDPLARANQRLVIGPWSHGTCDGCEPNAGIDVAAMQLAWMDQWLKGRKHPFFEHPVVIYVMGRNRWRAEESWPLGGTENTRYYLHSDGHANSAGGDGRLSTSKPESEEPDRYRYDPRNPAPTIGGIGLSGSRAAQNTAERRSDVLAFTSSVLTADVEVTGEVTATLYAASSAEDTDWWVKLLDVAPNGTADILDHGVVRARYRRSRTHPEPLSPGKVEKYEINMWATSNVFKKGHRIRVEVTSSNFPYADRNPNAFVDLASDTEKDFVVASQTVYHDAVHPSSVELPIIPTSRARKWIETPFPLVAETATGH